MEKYFIYYFKVKVSELSQSILSPIKLIIILVLSLSPLMTASLAHSAESAVGQRNSGLLLGKKLRLNDYVSDFTLKSHHGENIRLNELKGNVVLIEFWASWSGSSIRSLSQSEALFQKHKNTNFKVLSISIDPVKSKRISDKLNPEHSILFDYEKRVSRLYRIDTVPTFLLLDKSGKLVLVLEGVDPRYPDIIKHKVESILGQQ